MSGLCPNRRVESISQQLQYICLNDILLEVSEFSPLAIFSYPRKQLHQIVNSCDFLVILALMPFNWARLNRGSSFPGAYAPEPDSLTIPRRRRYR